MGFTLKFELFLLLILCRLWVFGGLVEEAEGELFEDLGVQVEVFVHRVDLVLVEAGLHLEGFDLRGFVAGLALSRG